MILVTGSSGQLGALVLAKACEAGLAAIGASRGLGDQAPGRRRLDFDDPTAIDLSGVETLFLVSAGAAEDDVVIRRHDAVIAAAEQQGVAQIVYTSLVAEGDHLAFALAHRWTERRLKESGLAWTILRNGLYAELIGSLAAPLDGRIRAPFGSAPIAPVAREDLADAAVAVLADPSGHVGKTFELGGVSAWRIADLAEALGASYEPGELAAERIRLDGLPLLPFQPAMLMSIYSATAAGFLASGRSDLPGLIDAPARDSLAIAMAAARQPA